MVSLLGGLIPAPHTVQHRAQVPDAADGPMWAAPVTVSGCRVERTSRQYQTPQGRVVTLTALVVMPAVPEVQVGDKLVVDGDERLVERMDVPVWLSGTAMHQEVWTT